LAVTFFDDSLFVVIELKLSVQDEDAEEAFLDQAVKNRLKRP
jgi:hypothetical protein